MAKRMGILLKDGDLDCQVIRDSNGLILSGLVVGDVTKQNQQTILLAEKGEVKCAPGIGVGIASYLDDESPSGLLREIRTNLRNDGQKVRTCGFVNGKLIIEAGYED